MSKLVGQFQTLFWRVIQEKGAAHTEINREGKKILLPKDFLF